MLKIHITFPDGAVFEVPAEPYAREYAEYHVGNDVARGDTLEEDKDIRIQEETDFLLHDTVELRDWISNNYDWKDHLRQQIRKIQNPRYPAYQDMLYEAELTVVKPS